MTLQDPVRRDQDLVLAEVGPVLGDVRLPVVHLPHVGVQRTALGEGLAARLAKQVPRRLQAWNRHVICTHSQQATCVFRVSGDLAVFAYSNI